MSRASSVIVLGALAVAIPSLARAQQPPEPRTPEPRTKVWRSGPDTRVMSFVMNRRARLGITVNLRARDTDSVGAYVDGVTPGGPADDAGIRAGDVITKLNGKSLLGGSAGESKTENGEPRSLPGLRLIEMAAKLEPNDTIKVEYRRGNDRKTVSVVTSDEPGFFKVSPDGRGFAYGFGDGADNMHMPMMGPEMDRWRAELPRMQLYFDSPLANLELAPLNGDLGQYFGTSDGVLVLSVGKNSSLGLKAGDVVQSIDGRKASSPGQLLRILRSYDPGESFKFDVVRKGKHETVTGKLPDDGMKRPGGRDDDRDRGGDGA
jgi:S1-C subfamily serine protease